MTQKNSSTPDASRRDAARCIRAASMIAAGRMNRSCCAIAVAGRREGMHYYNDPLVKRYVQAVLGTDQTANLEWPDEDEGDHPDNDAIRVLLLCFMAAMVEAGDA